MKPATKLRTADAALAIWEILNAMPSPNDAARALAGAHALLICAAGATDEPQVRTMLKESDSAVLQDWSKLSGVALRQ